MIHSVDRGCRTSVDAGAEPESLGENPKHCIGDLQSGKGGVGGGGGGLGIRRPSFG